MLLRTSGYTDLLDHQFRLVIAKLKSMVTALTTDGLQKTSVPSVSLQLLITLA